jgi:hypothetical protein
MTRTPEQVREYLRKSADIYKGAEIRKSHVGGMIGTFNKLLGGDEARRRVMAWLFRDDLAELHRRDTLTGEWKALYEWIGYYEEDGVWETLLSFKMELKAIQTKVLA